LSKLEISETLFGEELGAKKMNNKFQIRVHSGVLRGQAFIINKPEFKVGRDPSCDIILTENAVSRVHLLIYPQDFNNIVLVDNNSTNGTTVNNIAVTAPVQIIENDVVMLGGEVALVLERVPEVQNPYASYSQQNYQPNFNNPYAQSTNIPQYQPPAMENNPNYHGMNEKIENQINPNGPEKIQSSVPQNLENNKPEEEGMGNSQNLGLNTNDGNNTGNMPQQGFVPQQNMNQYPSQGQPAFQNNPDYSNPYQQQPFPGQSNIAPQNAFQQYPPQQQYPGQQNPQYQPMGSSYPQSQYPNQQNVNFPNFGQQNADSQYPIPQNQQSQFPGQPWNPSQNPYAGQFGQQQNDPMQQQPWMQNPNQQYQQPGYPNNQQQPGFGQQGNPTQSGQFYGGYPGYQQGYGNMNMPGYSQNDENQIDEEAAKRKRLYIILGAVLLFIIALIVFIIIIDTNYLWCDVFPFLWSAEACAIYP
jgi:pSer/pThr/pTyr-binding forkhead associated (FHA) protein